MTTFDHIQNGWIHFFDQLTGTNGGDSLTLDTADESSDPTGGTSIDGKGGNDNIAIGQYLGFWHAVSVLGGDGDDIVNFYGGITTFHSATVDGGSGTDIINLDASTLYADGLTFEFSSSFAIGGVNAINMEAIGLSGGAGDDELKGGFGNDTFQGNGGSDILRGGGGKDGLYGGDNDDKLYGGSGADYLNGDAGDDEIYGGFGINTINGGDGIDLIDYSGPGADLGLPVTVNLMNGIADISPDNHDNLSNVEKVVGTGFNDTLAGDLKANTLYGIGGNDILVGSPGTPGDPSDLGDFLYGGIGTDELYGKFGADTLNGDEDNDTLYGGDGDDTINGGDGDDHVYGGLGADTLDGGGDVDIIDYSTNATFAIKLDLQEGVQYLKDSEGHYNPTGETATNFELVFGGDAPEFFIAYDGHIAHGFGGDDILEVGDGGGASLYGGNGVDVIHGSDGEKSFLRGGGGADTILGGEGDEDIIGGSFEAPGDDPDEADIINGGGGDDDIEGDAGADSLDGGGGDDVIVAGETLTSTFMQQLRANALTEDEMLAYDSAVADASNHTLEGGTGNDAVLGAKGKDTINGGDGNDHLYGGNNNDALDGGKGSDALFGGRGNDTLDGGLGTDSVVGGDGNDIIVVAPLANGEVFAGGAGTDLIDFSAIGTAIIISNEGVQVGSAHGEVILFEKIYAGSGNDRITDGDASTLIRGNAGNDILDGGLGDDTLEGGDGNDTASYASSASGVTVSLGIGASQNTGGGGNDTLKAMENLIGSDHDDLLTGSGGKNDIAGGRGDDTINASDGNDLLSGDAGKDTLDGGTGADTFNYRTVSDSTGTKYDTIKNANLSSDKFDIQGAVTGIDTAIITGQLRSNSFNADMAFAVNGAHLGASHAVLFTPDSGSLAGKTFLIVDRNGTAGYQAGADIVIQLQSHTGSLDTGDFT